MKENKNIEEYFKEVLSNHEEAVDPQIWTNISNSIAGGGAAAGGSSSGFFAGAVGKIAALIGGLAVIATVFVLNSKADNNSVVIDNPQAVVSEVSTPQESQELSSNDPTFEPEAGEPQEEKSEISSPSQIKNQLIEDPSNPDPVEDKNTYQVAELSSEDNSTLQSDPSITLIPEDDKVIEVVQEEKPERDIKRPLFTVKQQENTDELIFNFATTTKEDTQYLWDFGNGDQSNEQSPQYIFDDEGAHQITFKEFGSDYELVQEKTIYAYYSPEIIIPDIFTPNNDNFNDYFDVLIGSKNVQIDIFNVFSLSSEKVFELTDDKNKWNGNDQANQPCEEGYYIYTIRFVCNNGEAINKSGKVFLKRS